MINKYNIFKKYFRLLKNINSSISIILVIIYTENIEKTY